MNAREMWQESGRQGSFKVQAFGSGADADRLAALILQGKKTATSSACYWYEAGEEEMPRPGECSVVVDSHENAVCIIRTTKVYVTEFDRVTAAHAAKEGEGGRTLAYWRKVHEAFFTEDLREAGLQFGEHMRVVCEEFEKVYPV